MSAAGHPGALGPHDLGGVASPSQDDDEKFVDLRKQDRPYAQWERQIHALLVLLIKKKFLSVDELRRGIEQLEPSLYNTLSYYEKWTLSMVAMLIERSVLMREELEHFLLSIPTSKSPFRDPFSSRIFKKGEKVYVKDEAVHRRWRKPHLRLPGYIHGAQGEIVEVLGRFPDPSYTAFRDFPGPPPSAEELTRNATGGQHQALKEERMALFQVLYTVRFPLKEIFRYDDQKQEKANPQRNNGSKDFIDVDIFHPWLLSIDDPTTQSLIAAQQEDRRRNIKFYPPPPGSKTCAPPVTDTTTEKSSSKDHHRHDHSHPHKPRCQVEREAAEKEGAAFPLQPLAEALITVLTTHKRTVLPRHRAVVGGGESKKEEKNLTSSGSDVGSNSYIIVSMKEIRSLVEAMDERASQVSLGAILVARAWSDPAFKELLMEDAEKAAASVGIRTSNYEADLSFYPEALRQRRDDFLNHFAQGHTVLRVVENTPEVHHLVVCTLCSCYPASVLGLSPDWYKSRHYRAMAVRDPRRLLRESFGLDIPAKVSICVHDSTAEIRYLVLPQRPKNTEGWSWQELAKLVRRDAMIGTAVLEDVVPKEKKVLSHL